MEYKLENCNFSSLKDLETKISQGASFKVFTYRIGLGLVSLLRFSPAFYIEHASDIDRFRKKYNRLNLCLGPWFFYKGPWLTYSCHKTNQLGGIDVTNDIMLNLTEESLSKREVRIQEIHNLFVPLEHSDLQNIKKCLNAVDTKTVPIEKAYAGTFINVEENVLPYIVIGFQLHNGGQFNKEYIYECLRKIYYKHVYFELFELKNNPHLAEKLIEQGSPVFGKQS